MTSENVVEMTRQELYDHVWTTPMRTLAGKWGISDVGLAKICQKHAIPRPAQGHWAKKKHGLRVHQKPLPAIEEGQRSRIRITSSECVHKPAVEDSEIATLIQQESEPDRSITVKDHVQIRNPIVKATKESLKGRRPNDYGRVSPNWDFSGTHFDLQVSPQNVSRALRILEVLTSEMLRRGYSLIECSDRSRRPYFDVLGERFHITLRESSKRSKRRQDESKTNVWSRERTEYTPTGILELCINYGSYSSDATLRDTKKKPLERRLNEAVVAMLRTVDKCRKQKETARIEAIEKAERKKIAFAEEINRRSDSARINRLTRLTQAWETHQRYSAFVEAVRQEAAARAPSIDSETLDWLTWADAFLRETDPLSGGEDLPSYPLSEEEREQLRCECEADWVSWSETFHRRQDRPGTFHKA